MGENQGLKVLQVALNFAHARGDPNFWS